MPCLRPSVALAAVVAALAVLAGCTSTTPTPAPDSVVTQTVTPSPTATAPIVTGPTTAAATTTCPYATVGFVHETMGFRLGRLTVLRSGGQAVGCRFYAQQHPNSQCDATCLAKEQLPGPNQPAVEITTQRYASSVAAHNAFVLRAGTSNAITQTNVGGTTGLCFPTAFYPKDKGTDYACTVNKGPVLVLVRTVDTTHGIGTSLVLQSALRAVAE